MSSRWDCLGFLIPLMGIWMCLWVVAPHACTALSIQSGRSGIWQIQVFDHAANSTICTHVRHDKIVDADSGHIIPEVNRTYFCHPHPWGGMSIHFQSKIYAHRQPFVQLTLVALFFPCMYICAYGLYRICMRACC